jgi:hypothetical protein
MVIVLNGLRNGMPGACGGQAFPTLIRSYGES